MASNCNTCSKIIHVYQSSVTCKLCKLSYHIRCIYTNVTDNWYCFHCNGEIFPFNHYVDDDEFKFALFCWENSIDFNRLISLKFNPFNFEELFRTSSQESVNLADHSNPPSKCSYLFDKNISCSGNNDFSILHFNSRSMNRNFDNIHNFISGIDHTFTVISISETWFNENNVDMCDIENYVLINAPRPDRRSGGSALYIHNSVSYRIREDLKLTDNNHSESVFIEILNSVNKNIIVGNVYRAHRTDLNLFLIDLENCLSKISHENKQCFISGDFNLDLLKHDTNNLIDNYLNIFYNNNMRPLIDRPTRITPTSATLIDNIFTNVLTHHITSGIFVTSLTDHYPIFQITNSNPIKHNNHGHRISSRLFNQNRIHNFYNHLSLVDWNFVTNINSCESAYDAFISKFLELYNIHFPLKSFRSNNHNSRRIPRKPWITTAVLKSIDRKEKLYKKYVAHPTESNKQNFHVYRNRLTSIIRASKKDYYAEKLSSCRHSAKQTWNVLNSILGRHSKPNLPTSFHINNDLISDPQTISDHFNAYFVNIGPKLASQISSSSNFRNFLNSVRTPPGSLFFSPTTTDEIIKLCMSIKSDSSSGHDDIKPEVVKFVSTRIAQPLAHIFNLSLSSGIVPSQLKIARVVPIFKSGDRHDLTNYRPISVLPAFSKILERLVHKRLYSFISRFDLLHDSQFGFRSNRSTYMAIMEAYTNIVTNLDNKMHTLGIFLDLSKAFDTINHDILLSKLSYYGIRGNAFEWFRNYLGNRFQYVNFNGHRSVDLQTTCGVPQGSILGPLLFILYINDISVSSKLFSYFIYADDTNLLISHNNLTDLIESTNAELIKISSWLKANKLSLNIGKTTFMLFKNRHNTRLTYPNNIMVNIDNIPISRVSHTKFLGVLLDDNLTWNQHNRHITSIVSKYSGILFRLKQTLPPTTLFSLYTTLVLPHIQYCNIIWADNNNCNLHTIHLKQKKIVRLCTNSHYIAHSPPLFKKLNTLTVFDIHKLQIALFMFKFTNNLLPSIFDSYFQYTNQIHSYRIRSSNLFRPHLFSTDLARNTIKTQGPTVWNSIDFNIRSSTSVKSFNEMYKRTLVSRYM